MHHCDYLILDCPVYGGAESEKSLIFLEHLVYERVLLGGPHNWGAITRVVGSYEWVARLHQVVPCGQSDHEVAVPVSSDV